MLHLEKKLPKMNSVQAYLIYGPACGCAMACVCSSHCGVSSALKDSSDTTLTNEHDQLQAAEQE